MTSPVTPSSRMCVAAWRSIFHLRPKNLPQATPSALTYRHFHFLSSLTMLYLEDMVELRSIKVKVIEVQLEHWVFVPVYLQQAWSVSRLDLYTMSFFLDSSQTSLKHTKKLTSESSNRLPSEFLRHNSLVSHSLPTTVPSSPHEPQTCPRPLTLLTLLLPCRKRAVFHRAAPAH